MTVEHRETLSEEVANSLTHGVGLVLAITAQVLLATFAAIYGTAWHVVGCTIFGATLILLYAASTLYHSVKRPGLRRVMRALDHSAIFLLIAGTYTPFSLVNLRGPWGWTLFGIVWGLALIGITLRLTKGRHRGFAVALYLAMGWTVLIALKPLVAGVAAGGIVFLAAGGLAYTLGVVFYVWRRLPFNHAVWHLFVLAGSVLHFFAVLLYVIPIAA